MSYRNDRFFASMKSLDELAETIDLAKMRAVSDGGRSVKTLEYALDVTREEEESAEMDEILVRARRLHAAEMRLRRAELVHTIPTLHLVCRYGPRRRLSILEIQRRRNVSLRDAEWVYFAHLKKIVNLFLGPIDTGVSACDEESEQGNLLSYRCT